MKTSTQLLYGGLAVAALAFTSSVSVAQSTPTNSAKRKSGSIVAVGPKAVGTQDSSVTTNPLHESHGNSGQNPLYEPKDKTAVQPGAGAANVQPYKDPEDMTTRYRPGNNKATGAHSNASVPAAGAADQRQKTVENPVGEMKTSDKSLGSANATESAQKKHPGNVKYNDFSTSGAK